MIPIQNSNCKLVIINTTVKHLNEEIIVWFTCEASFDEISTSGVDMVEVGFSEGVGEVKIWDGGALSGSEELEVTVSSPGGQSSGIWTECGFFAFLVNKL